MQAFFGVRCLGTALESGDSSPHSKEKMPAEAFCHHVGNYDYAEKTSTIRADWAKNAEKFNAHFRFLAAWRSLGDLGDLKIRGHPFYPRPVFPGLNSYAAEGIEEHFPRGVS